MQQVVTTIGKILALVLITAALSTAAMAEKAAVGEGAIVSGETGGAAEVPGMMEVPQNPAAIHHLPPFVTAPGETDPLFVAMAIFVLLTVLGIGIFYFKLHALPEQLAHRGQKVLFEIIAVLALLALFTHNHVFWIAALLLAFVPLPDFTTPLIFISRSLEKIAGGTEPPAPEPPPAQEAPVQADDRPVESRGGLGDAGTLSLFDADHTSGLSVSPLRAGQADRTRDHAVLGLV